MGSQRYSCRAARLGNQFVPSIIERIKKNQFWKFHGGIHPPEQKFLTNDKPIKKSAIPELLIIPVQQHIGIAADIIVQPGEYVLKGQPLTQANLPMMVPIHAPTSGKVIKIEEHMVAHPSGLSELCIFVAPDGEDTWRKKQVCHDYTQLANHEIIERIGNSGISGMGGAGFPTHIKVNTNASIEYLIINAAECEPYITADDLLMREHSAKIVEGIKILKQVLVPENILIGIEDNKPEAIETLSKVTEGFDDIHVCVLPTKYPTGGEKQLIQALTGKELPSGTLPSSMGIVMQNIATCFAIAEAVIDDIPLIRRVVTITGKALAKPQNIWAYIGTPVGDLLSQFGFNPDSEYKRIIMGGPMMGFTLPSDRIPIVKFSNCILTPSKEEISLEQNEVECIRCGQCAEVCPSQLLPQELQWSAKANDHEQLQKLNLFDCIDCGACAYVCPSHIPLVHYYRIAKADIRQKELLDIKAEKAKIRFEARKARLERDKKEREEKQRLASEARKAAMNAKSEEGTNAKSAVAAALARVKAKKAQQTGDDHKPAADDKTSQVSAAIARAKAKKEAKALENNQTNTNADSQDSKPNRSSAVAAAVAKAKAKKLAKAAEEEAETADSPAVKVVKPDDKKTKVSAAVAKAKAKKLAKTAEEKAETADTPADKVVKPDDKKAKVSAAVAKAKAKKLAKAAEEEAETADSPAVEVVKPDDKKAKVSVAVAKAKAKKLAKAAEEKAESIEETAEKNAEQSIDEISIESNNSKEPVPEAEGKASKQARVSAAIAKAKAKAQLKKESDKSPATQVDSDDKKKARIAAAIEKAKAKKQQRTESS
jgi:H+/Na+-translocating ferredoxin:NAD+ oxidoreductase subunit C